MNTKNQSILDDVIKNIIQNETGERIGIDLETEFSWLSSQIRAKIHNFISDYIIEETEFFVVVTIRKHRIKLRQTVNSIKEATDLVWRIFGIQEENGEWNLQIDHAHIYGNNTSGKRFLEEFQIGWEFTKFVDLEKFYNI